MSRSETPDVLLKLRPARSDDCRMAFEWANDPVTRSASFHTAPIAWHDHERWWQESLSGRIRRLYVVECDDEPAGLLRFDLSESEPDAARVGIQLAPAWRGRDLAKRVLSAGADLAAREGFRRLEALIRPENARSVRAFCAAEFEPCGEIDVDGITALRFERRLVEITSGRAR
jgi:RimJ/RimL family protein N-acetyltransferase